MKYLAALIITGVIAAGYGLGTGSLPNPVQAVSIHGAQR